MMPRQDFHNAISSATIHRCILLARCLKKERKSPTPQTVLVHLSGCLLYIPSVSITPLPSISSGTKSSAHSQCSRATPRTYPSLVRTPQRLSQLVPQRVEEAGGSQAKDLYHHQCCARGWLQRRDREEEGISHSYCLKGQPGC
jgi:hypothetical protein